MLYIFIGFSVLIALFFYLISPSAQSSADIENFSNQNYAHRGLHSIKDQIPENSLISFQRAAEKGYSIELDVRLTKDEQVVVFHDDSLLRMCGSDRLVRDCTYEELQSFTLQETSEKIPLFDEVAACLKDRTHLLVELKEGPNYTVLCHKTYEILKKNGCIFCIESFDPRIVAWFRKHTPNVLRGQLACQMEPKDMQSTILRFLLSNLLLNALSRPHFIAYRTEDMNHPVFRLTTKLLGAIPAGWTIRDIETYRAQVRAGTKMFIFESFEPNEK